MFATVATVLKETRERLNVQTYDWIYKQLVQND